MIPLRKWIFVPSILLFVSSGLLQARQSPSEAPTSAPQSLTLRSDEDEAQAILRRLPFRPVQISLHRGANRYAPENTLPAFEKALHFGADYVEFDVRASADGEFFLLHDSTLDRTTDGTGPIREKTAEEIRKLSAGKKFAPEFAKVRVPSLDEFLQEFGTRVGLYFDAKAIPPEALSKVLDRYHATDRTVVYQSADYLGQLKKINPNIRGLAPLNKPEELDGLITNLHPYAVDADWNILSKDIIDRCHKAGIRVFSDALGNHENVKDYLQAMDWGIDLIQTDCPLLVLRAMELKTGAEPPKPKNASPRKIF